TGAPFAFAWWKPLDQLRVQLGHNPDGNFGAAQITGWGYNGSAQDFVAIDNETGDFSGDSAWRKARSAGFYGGFSNVGMTLSILPVSGFDINLAVPLSTNSHSDGTDLTKELMKKFHVNVTYAIPDIGTVRVSFQGLGGTDANLGRKASDKVINDKAQAAYDSAYNAALPKVYTQADVDAAKTAGEVAKAAYLGGATPTNDLNAANAAYDSFYRSTGTAYASFYLTAIQGIRADFGVSYGMPYTNRAGNRVSQDTGLGFGFRYTADAFDVKFRAGTTFGMKVVTGDKDVDKYLVGPTAIGVGLLPSYNMGIMQVYFNMGLGWTIPNKDLIERDANRNKIINDWFINPYIRVPAGGLAFWAGFKVGSDDRTNWAGSKTEAEVIKWSLPIGVSVGF
ncbi:MAG: hypothetical protein LBB81_04530, partial [Treponema sp.]|nr:hypothetical protein [Treponema sp.]